MAEKITPQSLEAEQSTLGAMMMEPDAIITTLELLNTGDFYRELHQKIFNVIIHLFEKNEPVDLITVVEELRKRDELEAIGGAAYLTALIEACPSAANAESYAKAVQEKSALRQLLRASEAIAGDVYNSDDDAANVVERAEKRLIAIGSRQLSSADEPSGMEELILDYRKSIVESTRNPSLAFGIPTGFVDLDNLTSGWQDTDLIIIAARPSMGKTGMMLQTVLSVAESGTEPVAIFSLEMSKAQLIKRLAATKAGLDSNRIRKNTLHDDEWSRLHEATEALRHLPIIIFDKPAMTTFEIRAGLRRITSKFGKPRLIAIDYLQLAHHTGSENRTQEISEIARTLKTIARENVCPVIALSQLSRAVEQREDKRPILSDLRESGSIEAEADIVALMYRESYYKKLKSPTTWQQNEDDVAEVIIGKQRNGPTGTVRLVWRPECTRFENLAPGWQQEH